MTRNEFIAETYGRMVALRAFNVEYPETFDFVFTSALKLAERAADKLEQCPALCPWWSQ